MMFLYLTLITFRCGKSEMNKTSHTRKCALQRERERERDRLIKISEIDLYRFVYIYHIYDMICICIYIYIIEIVYVRTISYFMHHILYIIYFDHIFYTLDYILYLLDKVVLRQTRERGSLRLFVHFSNVCM